MATIPSGTKFLGVDPALTNLTEKKGTRLDSKTEYFSIEDLVSAVEPGPAGPQGVQGPAGPLGPVGPAGLQWRGAWVSGTSYIANDAVGYNGASWFCISATSGTQSPNLATANWALLASQGAQGIQGVQGPTGPQGPQGANQTLQQTVDLGNVISDGVRTQTFYANLNRFDNTSSGAFGIFGLGTISRSDISGNTQNVNLPSSLSGGFKSINFPNSNGTVALTSDIPALGLKAIQVNITQAEILNSSGFTKLLVAPVTGKVLIPISISVYRKSVGTGYTISNSVRLFSDDGSSSSSIGTALDGAFQNSVAGAVMQSITSSFNTVVVSGNSLKLVSGNLLSPSIITGGTGDLIVSIVYSEVNTTV